MRNDMTRLGDLCEFRYGKSLPEQIRRSGSIPVYGSNGVIGFHDEGITDGQAIVIGRKGTVGAVHLSSAVCWPIDTTYFIDRAATDVDLAWLSQSLSILRLAELNKAAAVPGLNRSDAYDLKLFVPRITEQRRIAAILDKADALRRKRKRALDLLDSLTQSIFLEMFGDLLKSSVYPRGTIGDWVLDFDSGKNLAPDPDTRSVGGFRVLKVSAVTTGSFLATESKPLPAVYIPPTSHLVKAGNLLFSRANTSDLIEAVAFVHTVSDRIALPDKIWRFVWNKTNSPNPRFVHVLFSTQGFRRTISKRATGTSGSMKNISKSKVLEIGLSLPPRNLQDKFVERLDCLQRSALSAAQQRVTLEHQFASLKHRAFSGQL